MQPLRNFIRVSRTLLFWSSDLLDPNFFGVPIVCFLCILLYQVNMLMNANLVGILVRCQTALFVLRSAWLNPLFHLIALASWVLYNLIFSSIAAILYLICLIFTIVFPYALDNFHHAEMSFCSAGCKWVNVLLGDSNARVLPSSSSCCS